MVAHTLEIHFEIPYLTDRLKLLVNSRVTAHISPLISRALTWSCKSMVFSCVMDSTLFGKWGLELKTITNIN